MLWWNGYNLGVVCRQSWPLRQRDGCGEIPDMWQHLSLSPQVCLNVSLLLSVGFYCSITGRFMVTMSKNRTTEMLLLPFLSLYPDPVTTEFVFHPSVSIYFIPSCLFLNPPHPHPRLLSACISCPYFTTPWSLQKNVLCNYQSFWRNFLWFLTGHSSSVWLHCPSVVIRVPSDCVTYKYNSKIWHPDSFGGSKVDISGFSLNLFRHVGQLYIHSVRFGISIFFSFFFLQQVENLFWHKNRTMKYKLSRQGQGGQIKLINTIWIHPGGSVGDERVVQQITHTVNDHSHSHLLLPWVHG